MAAEYLIRRRRRASRGLALVEIMVSLLIFLIGVLGVIGLQAKAVQYTVQAEDRSRAALLADDLVALMWGQQTVSLPDAVLARWNSRVGASLPEARATVAISGTTAAITITWKAAGAARGDASQHQYFTQVALP